MEAECFKSVMTADRAALVVSRVCNIVVIVILHLCCSWLIVVSMKSITKQLMLSLS